MARRILFALAVVVTAVSCSKGTYSEISLKVAGAKDSTEVVAYHLRMNTLSPVDTFHIVSGKVSCRLDGVSECPDFYYVDIVGGAKLSLLVSAGDRLEVEVTETGDVTVNGSDEAALLMDIEKEFAAYQKRFDELSVAMADAINKDDRERTTEAASELSSSFVEFKKASIRHIFENPASMTNVPILFRKVSGDLGVFGKASDVAIFKKVYDTLSVVYPSSPYVTALKDEIDSRNSQLELSKMLSEADAVSYPDISLPDITGEMRRLSSLSGKVIVLMFWSSSMNNASVMNAEIKRMYAKYQPAGLELYQVALDMDKPAWAASVKSQSLPWVSVIDSQGAASISAANFNVLRLPSLFVISKDGTIVARDVLDLDKLEKIIATEVAR